MMRETLLNDINERINTKEAELKALKRERSQLLADGENVGVGKRIKENQQSHMFHVRNLYMLCNDFVGKVVEGRKTTQKDMIITYLTAMYTEGGIHPPPKVGNLKPAVVAEAEYPKYRKRLTRYHQELKSGT